MKLRIMLVVLSMLAVMPMGQSRSAADYIAIADNHFDPPRWVAGSGETVEWRTTCSYYGEDECTGGHNVTAYDGATFASPSPIGHPGTFSVTLDSDGPIGYRCTLHSTLSEGQCTGMCGVIAKDADVTPPAATITEPGNDDVILTGVTGAVPIGGTATDDVAVGTVQLTIYDVLGRASAHQTTCTGCPGSSITWQRTLDLMPGLYTVEARAYDSAGNSRTSARVRFFVV